MSEIITFDKSYQERLTEFREVLSDSEPLLASQLKNEWSDFLELSIDRSGWQAIWKIPRLKCEELKISFPTMVVVYVQSIAFDKLIAFVKVVAVQDDINLNSHHYVPLIQLWPTKEQDKSISLDLKTTSNGIDMLRFFYTHIFMPWDNEDDDETTDWVNKHLTSRLHLFYNMSNGIIPNSTAEYLNSLLIEARRLQAYRENITLQLQENDEINLSETEQTPCVEKLLDVHIRLIQIRNEVELLENPDFRNFLIDKKEHEPKKRSKKTNWLILDQYNIDKHIILLKQSQRHIYNENIQVCPSLSFALENAETDDLIFLGESIHPFETLGKLQKGGTIKGLQSTDSTIMASIKNDVVLDCYGNVTIENVTIDVASAQCGILVQKGITTLNNCNIVGNGTSSICEGFIVLNGAHLNLLNCNISGFYTAIVGKSGAAVSLKNCKIHKVHFGLNIFDNCNVDIETSQFENCFQYGICVNTNVIFDNDTSVVGDFSILQMIPNFKLDKITGKQNGKGNAIIDHKKTLQPVQDLFSISNLDLTLTYSQEMDINCSLNSTIQRM